MDDATKKKISEANKRAWSSGAYANRVCAGMTGHTHSVESRKLMGHDKKGIPLTAEHRKKISEAHGSGENHVLWKGDDVGYRGLHTWVEKMKGTPQHCDDCGRTKPPKGLGRTRSYFQWANISLRYLRDVTDWKRLCCKCHKSFEKKQKCPV